MGYLFDENVADSLNAIFSPGALANDHHFRHLRRLFRGKYRLGEFSDRLNIASNSRGMTRAWEHLLNTLPEHIVAAVVGHIRAALRQRLPIYFDHLPVQDSFVGVDLGRKVVDLGGGNAQAYFTVLLRKREVAAFAPQPVRITLAKFNRTAANDDPQELGIDFPNMRAEGARFVVQRSIVKTLAATTFGNGHGVRIAVRKVSPRGRKDTVIFRARNFDKAATVLQDRPDDEYTHRPSKFLVVAQPLGANWDTLVWNNEIEIAVRGNAG